MNTNHILLPNGKTIQQTHIDSKTHTEKLYMETFAKGKYVIYWDERSSTKDKTSIRANPDGSEDLVKFDDSKRKTVKIKTLSEKGKGKFAYLLKRPEFLELKRVLVHA